LAAVFFCILVFLAVTFDTTRTLPERDHRETTLTPQVAEGKRI
jgi:hypothetical protein